MQRYPNPKPRKALWMEEPTMPSRYAPGMPTFLTEHTYQEYLEWEANLPRDQRNRLREYDAAFHKYQQDRHRYERLEKIETIIVVLTILTVIGFVVDLIGITGGSAGTGLCFSMYC